MNALSRHAAGGNRRRGLTLVELLIACSMTAMLAVVLGGLAAAVNSSSQYSFGNGSAAQHARVVLDRIERHVSEAYAAGAHPGFAVAAEQIGTHRFPDTLLIWKPAGGVPANLNGPPLARELVIVCPDPLNPALLVEITFSTDSTPLPLDDTLNQPAQLATLAALKTSQNARKTALTELLRTADATAVGQTPSAANLRGAVRFERELRPSAAAWQQYKAGTLSWTSLSWPQGLGGASLGLRLAALRIELQLTPPIESPTNDGRNLEALPFFGSAALTYPLNK